MATTQALARLLQAFPAPLADDVQRACEALPAISTAYPGNAVVSPYGLDGQNTPADIEVDGKRISIPARVYFDTIDPSTIANLPEAQQAIIGCVYTRHHHGYTRQRWLRRVVALEHPWVAPFVVQLAGEYVVEIVVDIVQGMPDLANPNSPLAARYGSFLAMNPNFWHLTRQRAASYWDCYHRGRYLRRDDYPVFTLLSRLERARRAFSASIDHVTPGTSNRPNGRP